MLVSNKKYPSDNSLCENKQVAANSYALATVVNGVCYPTSPFFVCRDYLHDAVYTLHTGEPVSVYGFNSGDYEWDGRYLSLCYRELTSAQMADRLLSLHRTLIVKNLPKINFIPLELAPDERLTVCEKGGHEMHSGTEYPTTHLFVIEVDPFYTQSMLHMGLLSSLLRLTWFYDMGKNVEVVHAEKYVKWMLFEQIKGKEIWPAIWRAFEVIPDNILNVHPDNFSTNMDMLSETSQYVHNSTGIYTLYEFLADDEWREGFPEYYTGINCVPIKAAVEAMLAAHKRVSKNRVLRRFNGSCLPVLETEPTDMDEEEYDEWYDEEYDEGYDDEEQYA